MPKPLPSGASLEHLKKQAKDLQREAQRGDPPAIARLAPHLSREERSASLKLSHAQHVIAREHGFDSWPKLKHHVESLAAARQRIDEIKHALMQRTEQKLNEHGSMIDRGLSDAALSERIARDVPLLAVRDLVLFPGVCVPLMVARKRSLATVEALRRQELPLVAVFCQHRSDCSDPTEADLQSTGVIARVVDIVPIPGEPTALFVDGLRRARLEGVACWDPYPQARVSLCEEGAHATVVTDLADELRRSARRLVALTPGLPLGAQDLLDRIAAPAELADAIAANLDAAPDVKGALLAASTLESRLRKVIDIVSAQLGLLESRQRVLTGS